MDLLRVPWGFQGRPDVLGSDLTPRHWAGLRRTTEAMDEDRRIAAGEGSPGLNSG